ncbi:MAG: glycosyltransferase [Janthinobacterium lividum]
MKKIRVLFHVTHLRRGGGIESSLMSWLRILDRQRYEVGLSIAYPGADIDAVFRPWLPADVPVTILGPQPWLSSCRTLKKEGRLGLAGLVYEELLLPQLRKLVFRKRIETLAAQYDLVIDYDLSLARFAPQLRQRTGKPLVGISHFSLTQKLSIAARDRRERRYLARARHYQRYDRLVAICAAMRAEAQAFFPAFADRFTTLYPGFDLEETRRRAAGAVQLPHTPYMVTVTRLEESQKDVQTLLRAFALMVQRHGVKLQLQIVGEGRDRPALEHLARELGIAGQVHFTGFLANPLPLVAAAQLLVLSSKLEGLPTVLIEGLILGQVLVSSDCPTGPREILDDGRAGLLVPPGDVEALCAALLRALGDDGLRTRLRAAASVHGQTFGTQAFAVRFDRLVEELLPQQAGAPSQQR